VISYLTAAHISWADLLCVGKFRSHMLYSLVEARSGGGAAIQVSTSWRRCKTSSCNACNVKQNANSQVFGNEDQCSDTCKTCTRSWM